MATSSSSSSSNDNEANDYRTKQLKKNRAMFEYSLSSTWCPAAIEWSSERAANRRRLIKYPFHMEWNNMENIEQIGRDLDEPNQKRRRYY